MYSTHQVIKLCRVEVHGEKGVASFLVNNINRT